MKEGPPGPNDGCIVRARGFLCVQNFLFVCFAVITIKNIDLSKKMRYSIWNMRT